jgi:hypothetical protein
MYSFTAGFRTRQITFLPLPPHPDMNPTPFKLRYFTFLPKVEKKKNVKANLPPETII